MNNMRVFNDLTELIGHTPLLRLNGIIKRHGVMADILAKVESFEPYSIKDRAAYQIITDAFSDGRLSVGATIFEATSGNTGIGLALVARKFGCKLKIVMPENMSEERKKILRSLGAELILTDKSLGMDGAHAEAERLAKCEGGYVAGQFSNPSNARAHYLTTAPEIYNDTEGEVAAIVSAIGTGGTISGIGKFLKEKKPSVRIIGVEPESSPLLSKGYAGAHKIQGIGANFKPEVLDMSVVDEIIDVSDEAAFSLSRELMLSDGVSAGISSGAALAAAVKLGMREEFKGKIIVVIFPDGAEKYLSTDLYNV